MIIEAPPLGKSRRPGLIQAATGPTPIERHAETTGTRWLSNACGSSHLYPPACLDVAYPAPVVDPASGLQDALTFVVYASIICPPVGQSAEKARDNVTERLEASEQRAVERALWGGEGTVPGLFQTLNTAGAVTLLAGTSASVRVATGQLEQQSAAWSYDGPTLLHARPGMGAYLHQVLRGPLSSDNGHAYTWYGSDTVLGAGYAGASPDNATAPDATTEYMAITGRILLGRSKIFYQDPPEILLDKVKNQRTLIAWRVYTIAAECNLVAMVKVTRA
jgi:hypothetical protein